MRPVGVGSRKLSWAVSAVFACEPDPSLELLAAASPIAHDVASYPQWTFGQFIGGNIVAEQILVQRIDDFQVLECIGDLGIQLLQGSFQAIRSPGLVSIGIR